MTTKSKKIKAILEAANGNLKEIENFQTKKFQIFRHNIEEGFVLDNYGNRFTTEEFESYKKGKGDIIEVTLNLD